MRLTSGIVLTLAVLAPTVVRAQECVTCWTDQCAELKSYTPKCGAAGLPGAGAECPAGKTKSVDTKDHCCWPGQAWSGKACKGIPTSCPAGFVVQGEECKQQACEPGKTRIDADHCCWPEQAWSSARNACIGVPTCPSGFKVVGEACVSAPHKAAKSPEKADPAAAEKLANEAFERLTGKDFAPAVAKAKAALALKPKDAEVLKKIYMVLGYGSAYLGDKAEAKKWLALYLPLCTTGCQPVEAYINSNP